MHRMYVAFTVFQGHSSAGTCAVPIQEPGAPVLTGAIIFYNEHLWNLSPIVVGTEVCARLQP
ncbi:hypothetical protein EXN66_Car011117 [Channa argus]|uniref:Uncharacterized protein n=1 Tax=Channa argus TaxID=215402 RepID=A0A6G1PYM8_CHAAH|nr:hypothetical protein EXN66_Car011117 [Channa argus]